MESLFEFYGEARTLWWIGGIALTVGAVVTIVVLRVLAHSQDTSAIDAAVEEACRPKHPWEEDH